MHFGKWLCFAALAVGASSVQCGRADDSPATGASSLAPVQTGVPLPMTALLGSVNGEPIFIDDIFRPIDAELRRLARVPHTTTGDFRSFARETITQQLNSRIGEMLVLKAAKDSMTDDDQKRLDFFMNQTTKDLISANGSSQAQADRVLRAQGSSFDKELAERKRKAIVDLYLHRTLWPKIVITRAMLLDEYQRQIKEFTIPASVNLYTITIPISRLLKEPDPAKPGQDRMIPNLTPGQIAEATNRTVALARELVAQLKAGKADFADLAHRYSADGMRDQGGHWKRVQPGMLASAEIEKTAFALHANTIADPIVVPADKDPAGAVVVIVRVDETTAGHVVPFAEAQAKLEQDLREKQYVTATNAYYRKLRAQAAMDEAVDKMVEIATDIAVSRYAVK